MDPAFKYWAFVSYSHQDKRWADWLHKSLESYRVPRRLAGRPSRDGTVPRRLFPIFRDREELPTSADLGANIAASLAQARYLIVICSPQAAVSRWVAEEIKSFKLLGREDRILALIVDGEPNASDQPGQEARECFPEPLRFRVAPDRSVIRTEHVEPIAADARRGGDGRERAKVKVLAGLLGVNYDDLWQRERRRRLWRRVRRTAEAVALAALVAGVWHWVDREARIKRYTDLGRQEYLQGNPDRALAYLSAAYSGGGTAPAIRFLLQQARAALPNASPDQHTMGVFSADFDPTNTRVVTASEDHTAKIWDAATGRCLATLRHAACVNSAVFSPDGRVIVTGCDDGTAQVWEASATGGPAPLATLKHGRDGVFPAVFNRTGNRIATASQDGTAKVWNAATFGLVTSFAEHGGPVNSLEFNGAGTAIVTASDDGTARIWDAASGRSLAVLGEAGSGGLRYAVFSPDGARVATCSRSGEVRLWRSDGTGIATLAGHTGYVRRAAFNRDGTRLVTASADGTARIWDGETGAFLLPLDHAEQAERKTVYSVSFRPDGQVIATAGANGLIKLWDASNGRLLQALDCGRAVVYGVEFSRDGRWLSSAGDKGLAFVWDVASPDAARLVASLDGKGAAPGVIAGTSLLHVLPGHGGYVATGRFSSDARRVVTVDGVGRARVWATDSGRLIALLPTGRSQLNDATLDATGSRVLTGADDGTAGIWEVGEGTAVLARSFAAFHGPVRTVRFSPDQHLIAVAGEVRERAADGIVQVRRAVKLIDAQGGDSREVPGSAPAVSPDGRYWVTVDTGNLARVWQTDGRAVATLAGHTAPIMSVDFDRAGRRVVTAGDDGTVIVWDLAGRQLLPPLKGHGEHGLFFAAFSPDDHYILSIGSDNTARVWDARNGQAVAALEGGQKYIVSAEFKSIILPSATFSADAALVVTRSLEPDVMVWELSSGRMLARFTGHRGNVSVAAFSPVGALLLTGAQDGTARIWNVGYETATPAEIARFVREKVPWRLEGDKLVSSAPAPAP